MEVIRVNNGVVTIRVDNFKEVSLFNGRIVSKMGYLTPVEYKQVHRRYHAIINPK